MEENQRTEETIEFRQDTRPFCEKHPFLKSILTGLLIFLGAYCAFYTVTDWHMKRILPPNMFLHQNRIEHMMNKEMRKMDKMMRKGEFTPRSANVIHLEQSKDFYKIIIDLRVFDNNENNVQVTANGNILTINGRSIRKSKNEEQISEFQQSYMFGNNVKLANLTKETNGNYYIITIPIGNTNQDD